MATQHKARFEVFQLYFFARFMSNPTKTHWDARLRILRYLKSVPDHGIFFVVDKDPVVGVQLFGWIDFDWVGDIDSRRSTIGYCFTWVHSSPKRRFGGSEMERPFWSETGRTKWCFSLFVFSLPPICRASIICLAHSFCLRPQPSRLCAYYIAYKKTSLPPSSAPSPSCLLHSSGTIVLE